MLNVLEDYLRMSGMPLERIDGSVAQRDRQVAIDRFSKGVKSAMTLRRKVRCKAKVSLQTLSAIAGVDRPGIKSNSSLQWCPGVVLNARLQGRLAKLQGPAAVL